MPVPHIMRANVPALALGIFAGTVSPVAAQNVNGAHPIKFQNVAPQLGADVVGFGRGSAIVDLDLDGRLDLIATSATKGTFYLRQQPNGTFVEMTQIWQIPQDTKQTWGTVAADFDNDGDEDLYFPCGGFHYPETNRFLRNDLNTLGTFTLLTGAVAGDAVTIADPSFGASALDYDRDGDLDIFTSATQTYGSTTLERCRLLRNDGGLHFTDVSLTAGITQVGNYKHCGVGDIDNDGWPDIGVGNFTGPNLLYRNMGNGRFIEIAAAVGLADPDRNFGFVFSDLDNDGWMDVVLPKYLHGGASHTDTTSLYLNKRNGTFRDVSAGSGIGGQEDMGHNVADVNGDGFPDYYVGAGHPMTLSLDVLYLLRPDFRTGGIRALDISGYSGIRSAGPGRNHGTPVGDVNRDGFIDIWAVNGGPSVEPASIQQAYLWYSLGNANRSMQARLVGKKSNRDGIGARLMALTADGREVHRMVSAGKGFTNTDSYFTHFGLGETTGVQYLRINWPSGIEQFVLAPPLGGIFDVAEAGIWTNGVAQIGSSVPIEYCSVPGNEVDVFYGGAPSLNLRADLGGFMRIAPPLFYLPSVTVPASGTGSVPLDIQNNPQLVGFTVYVQAGMHDPLRPSTTHMLTNRLDLVIQ